MTTPIVTPNLLAQMRTAQAPMPALPAAPVMPSAMSLPVPAAPLVSKVPTAMDLDQKRVNDLHTQGSGIDQIHNPLLRGIARAGDIAASVFGTMIPGVRALNATLPGTTLHHQVLVGQAERNLANDQATQKAADADAQAKAQTAQTEATTDYTQQRPEIEAAKIQQKRDIANNKNAATLAPHGFIQSIDPETGVPTITEDTTSQAYRDRQTLTAMHQATADKDQIMGEIAQNHYQPGTPEYAEAQRKLAQVDERLRVAVAGLGLRQQGLQLRKQNTQASLYGTDLDGNPLPGAPLIANDEGGTTVVGSKNAGHAIAQQASVGSFKDLSGSLSHTRTALQQYFNEGGTLADPRFAAAMSSPEGLTSAVIHGWVQSGMSPSAIAALTAVKQYHEQAGILRTATKGTASEASAQRILETAPTVGDSNSVALSKLDEGQNVIDRLTPGVTRVAGGISVPKGGQAPSGAPKAGDVVDGFRFKGGNPADQKNWEKR